MPALADPSGQEKDASVNMVMVFRSSRCSRICSKESGPLAPGLHMVRACLTIVLCARVYRHREVCKQIQWTLNLHRMVVANRLGVFSQSVFRPAERLFGDERTDALDLLEDRAAIWSSSSTSWSNLFDEVTEVDEAIGKRSSRDLHHSCGFACCLKTSCTSLSKCSMQSIWTRTKR